MRWLTASASVKLICVWQTESILPLLACNWLIRRRTLSSCISCSRLRDCELVWTGVSKSWVQAWLLGRQWPGCHVTNVHLCVELAAVLVTVSWPFGMHVDSAMFAYRRGLANVPIPVVHIASRRRLVIAVQCKWLVLVCRRRCLLCSSVCLLIREVWWTCVEAVCVHCCSLQWQSATWLLLSVSASCAVCAFNFAALDIYDAYEWRYLHYFGK